MKRAPWCFRISSCGCSAPRPWVTVGVDVGKQRDPATIAITTAERHATPTGRSTVLWIVRSLEKLPLGTDYPRVADRIRDICFVLRERYTRPRFVYLDATGVGAAICDMLVERRVEHVPCTFVSGEKRTEHYPDTPKGVYISGGQPVERVSLGKGFAVGRLLGIMDNKRLKAPKSPIWPELRKELMAFELTATSMHDRYGASPGQHDDLITALALCVQADPPTNGVDHAVPGSACRRTAGGPRVDPRSTQPQHPRPIADSLKTEREAEK